MSTGADSPDYTPVNNPTLLLASVMLSSLMVALDTTIANVALPHMQGSLAATHDQMGWVLTSYIVATAIFIPPTGFLAARLGRRRLMSLCVCGFLAASMLCGTATTLEEMVIYRFAQGACGAIISPLGQALVMDHFPAKKRPQILSLWAMAAMMGPVFGPTIGGYLTETFNWRWVFYLNIPICALAMFGILRTIPAGRSSTCARFDFFGFALLSVGIVALQLMLDRGQSLNWLASKEITVELFAAVLLLYLFAVHIGTAAKPFISPSLFKDRNLLTGSLMMMVVGGVLTGQLALLPGYLQQLMGIPVDTVGWLMAPRGAASVVSMALTAKLITRVDSRVLIIAGLLLLGGATFFMSQISLYVSQSTIITIVIFQGLGMGFVMAPLASLAFTTLPQPLRTDGAAIFTLIKNTGNSVGVSLVFTQIASMSQIVYSQLGEHITAFNSSLLPGAWRWNTTAGAMVLNAELTRQATSVAYLNTYQMMAALTLALIPLCFMLRIQSCAQVGATARSGAPDILPKS